VDLNVIRQANLKVVFDPMWGAARGYSDELLRDAGVPVATVHDLRDVLAGGHAPEPDDPLLGDLRKTMQETGAKIGIATDGDADRFGIVCRRHIPAAKLRDRAAFRLPGGDPRREEWGSEVGGDYEPDQCFGEGSRCCTARNSGRV
jgi:Phosphoglucomutase/phosphomannomutase, alpha/beta/alpha domain II